MRLQGFEVNAVDFWWKRATKAESVLKAYRNEYGVPRKLKCAGCQVGDHCNGEDDSCYCECTEKAAV